MKTSVWERNHCALTLIEVLVIIAALVLLVAFLVPTLATLKWRGSHINCVNNVKQIWVSFRMWAEDNSGKYPMQVPMRNGGTMELVESGNVYPHFAVMSNQLVTPKLLICPEDKLRKSASSFAPGMSNSNISYFVGVDATTNQRAMFLSGDANLAIRGVPAKPGLLLLWTNSPVAWAKPLRLRHGNGGNVVFTDGYVHQVDAQGLRKLLEKSGVTNRLAIP